MTACTLPGPKSCLIFLCGLDFQLEPQSTELAQEEHFEEVLKEYELKCRVRAPPSPFTILSLSILSWTRPSLLSLVHGALTHSCPAPSRPFCSRGS